MNGLLYDLLRYVDLEMFFDKYDDFISCGKTCSSYIPRNGKSGCCKYRKNAYTYIEGTEYILNVDGILEEIK